MVARGFVELGSVVRGITMALSEIELTRGSTLKMGCTSVITGAFCGMGFALRLTRSSIGKGAITEEKTLSNVVVASREFDIEDGELGWGIPKKQMMSGY